MIIPNNPIQRVNRLYQSQQRVERQGRPAELSSGKDKVILSNKGKELQAIAQQLARPEEIRDKAEALKAAVTAGTYRPSSEEIAQGILQYLKQRM